MLDCHFSLDSSSCYLKLYSPTGNEVLSVTEEVQNAGHYQVIVDWSGLPSGDHTAPGAIRSRDGYSHQPHKPEAQPDF